MICKLWAVVFSMSAIAAWSAPTSAELFDRAAALLLPAASEDGHAIKRGDFAADFIMPASAIWRAVLEVDNTTELFINGRRVEDASVMLPRPVRHTWMPENFYGSRPVNIAPYLHAGRNRVCLRGARDYVWMRGAAVMVSGERVVLDTGTNWHWVNQPRAGWTEPDFALDDLPRVAGAPRPRPLMQPDQPCAAPLTTLVLRGPRGFKQRWAGGQPACDGLMELRNPDDLLLFFRSEQDARLEVDIPAGCGACQPRLEWVLERYAAGEVQPVNSGECRAGIPSGNSLRYAVPLGRLPRGVYLFSASLFLDGTLADTLPPEPLAVIGGKLEMTPTAGTCIEDGLALALEEEIGVTFKSPLKSDV